MAIAAIAGALAGAVGSGGMSLASAALQEHYAQANTRSARHFAELMASTQYQRTVADLSKAGLNPALAYVQGATGTGANVGAAPTPNVDFGDVAGGLQKGITAAKEMQAYNADLRGRVAAGDQAVADAEKSRQAAKIATSQATSAAAEAEADAKYRVQQQQFATDIQYETYNNLVKQGQLLDSQRAQVDANRGLTSAQELRTLAETRLRQFDASRGAAESKWWQSEEGQRTLRMQERTKYVAPLVSSTGQALTGFLR